MQPRGRRTRLRFETAMELVEGVEYYIILYYIILYYIILYIKTKAEGACLGEREAVEGVDDADKAVLFLYYNIL